jgi:hypothetical protein
VGRVKKEEKESQKSQIRWYMSVIPALGRLRQKHLKLEASLGYLVRPCLNFFKKSGTDSLNRGEDVRDFLVTLVL